MLAVLGDPQLLLAAWVLGNALYRERKALNQPSGNERLTFSDVDSDDDTSHPSEDAVSMEPFNSVYVDACVRLGIEMLESLGCRAPNRYVTLFMLKPNSEWIIHIFSPRSFISLVFLYVPIAASCYLGSKAYSTVASS